MPWFVVLRCPAFCVLHYGFFSSWINLPNWAADGDAWSCGALHVIFPHPNQSLAQFSFATDSSPDEVRTFFQAEADFAVLFELFVFEPIFLVQFLNCFVAFFSIHRVHSSFNYPRRGRGSSPTVAAYLRSFLACRRSFLAFPLCLMLYGDRSSDEFLSFHTIFYRN